MSKVDIQIVQRAAKILDSPAKWNRKDNRECPDGAKTFSIYCALEKATKLNPNDAASHRFLGLLYDRRADEMSFSEIERVGI